jgi:hypothetical protein
MLDQFDLFGQTAAPETAKSSAVQSIKVKPSAAQLTPAQRRFNKLISRLDNLNRQMVDFDRVIQRHRMPYLQSMEAIEQRLNQCRREILLFLHQRRQGKGLTASEKKFSFELIKGLLEDLDVAGDAELQAVLDLYHPPEEQAQQAEAEALAQEALRQMMQELAGQPVPGLDSATSPEEMMAAVRAHMASEDEKLEAQREAKRAKKAPTARQKQAQQTQQDADSTIRSIFRQLASALHPDREPDPAERERKTELMTQANTAYERRDLNMLLRLQMQVAQIDEQSIAKLTDEKLATMSTLLKDQVAALEQGLAEAEMRASHEFGFIVSSRQSEASLLSRISNERRSMEGLLDAAQADLIRVQNDAGLKQWLKEQKMYSRQMARQEIDLDDFPGGFFYSGNAE